MATSIGIEPLADRVVVLPSEREEKISASGIIISGPAQKEKPSKGTVVAVGPGRTEEGTRISVGVSVGDTVLFSKYGYEEIEIEGKEYFILAESNILAVIK